MFLMISSFYKIEGGYCIAMARGRKKAASPEEQLQQIIEEISTKENELKELKVQKKELEEKIKNQKLEDLYSIIKESGKSLDEIKELINK